MLRILFISSLIICTTAAFAQQRDSTLNDAPAIILADSINPTIATDSITAPKKSFFYRTFKQDYPNPKKAAYLALFPGMGQIYNKKWWKVPLVYGAIAGIVIAVDYNQSNYNRFQTAYLAKVNDETHEFEGTRLDDANTLRNLRNGFDKNRQLSYVGGVLVFLLQGVDAFVDAHLASFDINEDLTLKLDPKLISTPQNTLAGIGLSIQF